VSLGPLSYRPADLVVGIMGYVIESERPVVWAELVEAFTGDHARKTVENTIRELVNFGALARSGDRARTARQVDTRTVVATTLGAAWLAQDLLPLPRRKPATRDPAADPPAESEPDDRT
jgi:hypothetical protein